MYKKFDVVEIKDEFRGGEAVILDVKYSRPKYPYVVKILTSRSERFYKLGEMQIARKLRELDANDPLRKPNIINEQKKEKKEKKHKNGQDYAKLKAQYTDNPDKTHWQILADAEINDKIIIKIHGKEQIVTFNCVNPRSPKYVFTATNQNGTTYKYPLGVVVDILKK